MVIVTTESMRTHKSVEPEDVDAEEVNERDNPRWRKQINVTISRDVVHAARELGEMEHRSLSNTVEFALSIYVKMRTQQVRQEREELLRPQIPPPVKMPSPMAESVEG